MAKQGYTFYPKDWGNSESVFELNLSERGLYREFIDLAMLNDNCTEIKKSVWCRKFAVSIDELESILSKLLDLNLIEYRDNILFIPSCENRLNLVRGGKRGGEANKPTPKPIVKPIPKPTPKQIEIESKIEKEKESKSEIDFLNKSFFNELQNSESWIEVNAKNNKITILKVKYYLLKFNDNLIAQIDKKNNKTEYASHFARWLPLEIEKDKKNKPPTLKKDLI